jgi:hypothetical protein
MENETMNGVSKMEEFKAAALADRAKRSVLVKLPSGLTARLVRVSPQEMFLRTGRYPQTLAARIAPSGSDKHLPAEDVISFARTQVDLVEYLFFDPRIPEDAKPGIDIPFSDIEWALQWARGEVDDSGRDLAAFPDERSGAERTATA